MSSPSVSSDESSIDPSTHNDQAMFTPIRDNPTTRASSDKAALYYVSVAGGHSNVPDITGFVVVLDANTTSLDGPVFGVVCGPASVKSKGKSQRSGVVARELFEGNLGGVSYIVDKQGLEFITAARHAADMDNLLYRHGRLLDCDLDELYYGQVTQINFDNDGTPNGMMVCPRGLEGKEHWFRSNPWEFRLCSQLEFLLNYGVGEKESRHNLISRWGLAISNRAGKAKDLKTLIGTQKNRPVLKIDFKDKVTVLSEDGDTKVISTDDYLAHEGFKKPVPSEKHPTSKPKAKRAK